MVNRSLHSPNAQKRGTRHGKRITRWKPAAASSASSGPSARERDRRFTDYPPDVFAFFAAYGPLVPEPAQGRQHAAFLAELVQLKGCDSHKLEDSHRFNARRRGAQRFDTRRFDARRFDARRFDARRFDARRFDARSCGLQRFGAQRFDTRRFDARRIDARRIGSSRIGSSSCGLQRLDTRGFDTRRFDTRRFDAHWFDAHWFGTHWFDTCRGPCGTTGRSHGVSAHRLCAFRFSSQRVRSSFGTRTR
jgi:hypothetical protein